MIRVMLAAYIFFCVGLLIGINAHRFDISSWKRDQVYVEKQFWWPTNRNVLTYDRSHKI